MCSRGLQMEVRSGAPKFWHHRCCKSYFLKDGNSASAHELLENLLTVGLFSWALSLCKNVYIDQHKLMTTTTTITRVPHFDLLEGNLKSVFAIRNVPLMRVASAGDIVLVLSPCQQTFFLESWGPAWGHEAPILRLCQQKFTVTSRNMGISLLDSRSTPTQSVESAIVAYFWLAAF
jgi:hypothetical protein